MIHVSLADDPKGRVIIIEAPARLAPLVSAMPGFRAKGDTWYGPAVMSNLIAVAKDLGVLEGFTPTPEVTALLASFMEVSRVVEAVKAAGLTVPVYDDRLFDYQNVGVWMLRQGGCLMGDDMGTGKTVMALTAARQAQGNTLVVAPNSMKHTWAREAETWFPEAEAIVIHGTAKQKAYQFTQAHEAEVDGRPLLVCVNWESLRSLTRLAGYGSIKLTDKHKELGPLNQFGWDYVIADEAHRAKDPTSQQTRGLWYVSKRAQYRWGLTGTPMLNTPGDLWAIGRFYDPDSYGTTRHGWHARFVDYIETNYGPKDIGLSVRRGGEFTKSFDTRWIRRLKREVKDLPPRLPPQVRMLEMGTKQKAAYNKMVKDLIARIGDGILVATDPLALLTRLSQIASALPVLDAAGEVVALDMPSNKVSALLDFVSDELPEEESLVVFAPSRKLIELAGAELTRKGHEVVYITGSIDAAQRDINVQRFQAGEVRIILCTMGAGSEGITLTRANTTVFLNRGYAYGQSVQAESRTDRIGQTSPVTMIDFVSIGTVDEEQIAVLHSKGEMAEEVLRDKARTLLETKL